ncbi:MAG: patatin-like phospholipase family protein [Verrucomicrobiales bacterium]|nr:patatin-like phospholipase family protein [Verrucomicrobiales bacterium]
MMDPLPTPDRSLALTLDSAFLGFYTHAGFLQGLAEGGCWPAEIAGASAGALVGGLVAAGNSPRQVLDLLLSWDFRTAFYEAGMVVGLPFWPIYRRRYSGASKGNRILAWLKRHLGDLRLEDTAIPFGIAVTNLSRVRAEVKREGPLAELIVASCAYPTVLSHQVVEGDALWDGGIALSPPFIHWLESPTLHHVLAHCIGVSVVPPALKMGVSDAFALSHDIIGEELFELRRQKMAEAGKTVERVVTPTRRPKVFITERAGREFFEAGRQNGLRTARTQRDAKTAAHA